MPRISGQPIIVQRSTGLPVAFGRTDAPGGVQFAIASRCFALLRRTQSLGDAIDRDAPISVICAGQAERLERHGWTAAVAENAGAGLPRVAEPTKSDPRAETARASIQTSEPASAKPRSGWIIQVGAYPDESVAKQRLNTVKSKASKLLSSADPFTESTSKGGTTYFRARFAGLSENQAEAACKYLKRNDVDCIAIKN